MAGFWERQTEKVYAKQTEWLDLRRISAAKRGISQLNDQYAMGILTTDKYKKSMGTFTDEINRTTAGSKGLSRTLNLQNLSFRTVGEAVANAVLKVGLWIAATTLVIGAVRKMQQTMQLWKDLEVTLERIGITTSTLGEGLYRFFDITADVAVRMGMPIEQTLKGMDLALRATASEENQAKRTTIAQLMLRDAAILGNVAGMQFSQAIDILVGSLRQTGMSLDQGIILLDKWVAVAKSAAVSVNDLSQGFAIMSSAAASAGLNIDQVNGIIAALSEAVTLGPVQVGNAIRALMATLYNPGSIETMRRFGIAVRDATGEFRSFWAVMSELSSMVVTGALDEKQILQIAKAAGAGQRRYAQFVALLKNWGSAVRAANISANAHGDALSANERIINTLTNAWDQFTAAQNKFWYALGDKSGMISDLTGMFQAMASVFSRLADVNEPMARAIKLIAQLTVALLALKLVAMALTRLHVTAWLGGLAAGVMPLMGLAPGIGQIVRPPGLARANITSWGQFQAPKGGYTLPATATEPSRFMQGGRYLPIVAQPLGRGEATRTAWGGVGGRIASGMLSPMRGVGLLLGTAAGGMIMRQLLGSNWAGIGGAVGAGIGGFLGGPAGMIVGAVIGGGIAKLIEEAGMTFEERIARERERWLKDLPLAVSSALERLHGELSFAISDAVIPPLSELIKEQAKLLEGERVAAQAELDRLESIVSDWESLTIQQKARIAGEGLMWTEGQIQRNRERIEVLTGGIAKMEELQRRAADAQVEITTLYDKAAILAKEIRLETGMQAAAEARVEEIKKRSLDLTYKEKEELISLAYSAPIAYSNMLSRLKIYIPSLAKEFEAAYPTYEDFVVLKPEAYGPLQEILATILGTDQDIAKANEDIANASKWLSDELGGTETTTENISKQYDHWKSVQDAYLDGLLRMEPLYELFGLEETAESEEKILAIVNKIVDALNLGVEAKEAMVSLDLQRVTALAMASEALEHMNKYIEPGRLAFFSPEADIGRIQQWLNRYKTMFEDFIDSEADIYHAFIKDEQGVVQGFYKTFEAQPEVWSAMLGELQGIEENTKKALEAEYNLPSWYVRPTRYWAMKTTGTQEFGPAQTGLWELWMEFLARQDDTLKETTAAANFADNAIVQLDGSINTMAQNAVSAAEQIEDAWGFIGFPNTKTGKLTGFQFGGVVPATGAYLLHKKEVVVSGDTMSSTNSILNNSYRVLAVSQQYLSNINLGILGVRQELQQLRYEIGQRGRSPVGETPFERTARSGYVGVSALGVRK